MNTITKNTEFSHLTLPTEYLRSCKKNRILPSYDQYRALSIRKSEPVVSEKIYDFLRHTIYDQRPNIIGIKHKIYRQNGDIVEATFLRQFTGVRVWQLDDTLIVTNPMNTELMSGTYQQIFSPVLG
jgi:hypothetical protein